MIAIMLAAFFTFAVEPQKAEPRGDRTMWVRASDLSKTTKNASRTTFDLTIDENGKPVECNIIIESGRNDLDQAVCRALMKRARFRPATDENGSTVHYVYRDRVTWLPQGQGDNAIITDADLVIISPESPKNPDTLVEVLVVMPREGSTLKCIIAKASGTDILDKLACEAAINPKIALPITDGTGDHVSGIRSFFVAFEPGSTVSVKVR